MKIQILVHFLFVLISHASGAEASVYENAMEGVKSDPSPQNVLKLGGHIRGIARYNHPPESHTFFNKMRNVMLSTPGHARYFADKLEEEHLTSDPQRFRGNFVRYAYWYLNETLVHLPSPETVAVLGHYLNDERDKPVSSAGGADTPPYPGTHMLAFEALSQMGLRDLPPMDLSIERETPPPGERWTDEKWLEVEVKEAVASYRKKLELLTEYRSWWEEVKSGKRTFSFKGQAVEYRFRPDGTWETIPIANPPDDGPKPVPAAPDSEIQTPPSETVDSVKPEDHYLLWWITGIAGVLLAVALALFIKFRRTA
jgi:hypothetical protein